MKSLAMACIALCLLTACGPSTRSTKMDLPSLPEELRTCPQLQSVAGRVGEAVEVSDARIKSMWAQDRTVAVQCYRKHEALVSFYETLRESVAPKKRAK